MPYLIGIAIGPVQEFIASARRSRDLWYGSWLLSELSKAAAKKIVELNGNKLESLVFPAPKLVGDLDPFGELGVANKILGKVTDNLPDAVVAIRNAVGTRLQGLSTQAYSQLNANDFDLDTARKQIADLLEFYWAAVEVTVNSDGDIQDYSKARDNVEALLAARKVTRNFDKVSWGSDCPKSSLDGQRESVIPEQHYPPPNATRAVREEKAQLLWQRYNVRVGERLCGVGLLKRHGLRDGDQRFFSTSHVAALPLMDRFCQVNETLVAGYKTAFDSLRTRLQDVGVGERDLGNTPGKTDHPVFGRRDGHLLFENRLSDFISHSQHLEQAKKSLRDFLMQTVKKEPLPYYALLHADGDRMGKVIDHQRTEKTHRQLSQDLAEFANNVKTIVEGHKGSLVYAGGDDVLAFLPLHEAIHCTQALATDFRNRMYVHEDAEGFTPTLSAGIAVAHHLDPLSDALELARKAEKAAKSLPDKNALAVTVSKRSGVDRTVKDHWGKLDQRLLTFIRWHCQDLVPDGAAYELHDLARRLTVEKSSVKHATLEKAIQAEALRIWKRKRANRGTTEVRAEILAEIKTLLESGAITVTQLAEELIVARIFADAKELANPAAIAATANGGTSV